MRAIWASMSFASIARTNSSTTSRFVGFGIAAIVASASPDLRACRDRRGPASQSDQPGNEARGSGDVGTVGIAETRREHPLLAPDAPGVGDAEDDPHCERGRPAMERQAGAHPDREAGSIARVPDPAIWAVRDEALLRGRAQGARIRA